MRDIRKIVVHCTASPDSLDIGVREVRDWHLERGWSDIGYHWLIRRNGKVEAGRSEEIKGAHVRGHNSDSIGIVWVGEKQIDPRQTKALLSLLRRLMDTHDVAVDNVFGHYEFDDNKTCPNLDMNWLRAELLFTKGDK